MATVRRPLALLALATLAALTLWTALGAWSFPQPSAANRPTTVTDQGLYAAIVRDVAHGRGYYAAVAHEQRAMGFPLRPVVAVRPPALAMLTAALGPAATFVAFGLLALGTGLALALAALRQGAGLAGAGLAVLASAVLIAPGHQFMHELWAGLLCTLAFSLHARGRWRAAVAVALLAALIREHAVLFLGAMAAAALLERRSREFAWWAAAAPLALAYLAWHWAQVSAIAPLPGDAHSPGWGARGGWIWATQLIAYSSLLILAPLPLGHLLALGSLVGWLAAPRPLALRAGLWLGGMTLVFMLVARPGNAYWGGLVAPLLPLGLAWLPRALTRLWSAARPQIRMPALA